MRRTLILLISWLFLPAPLLARPLENGFCVRNASTEPLLFAVDAGENGRDLRALAPTAQLCLRGFPAPVAGFVSVFTSRDAVEGCSRLAANGSVQVLLDYQDFDRCTWQTLP